jgi:carbon monoxide dehydrogenase subunit G
MELEHTFTVPVPEERAWDVLLDVERVAPCMPGASLDSVQGDEIKGRIKVKVGPISMTYAGTARFTERDPQAHVITLEATGKETRGAGTASATVRSMLEARGDQTHVIVHTTLNVTGRPAQFGRGVMAEVGGKLIGIFAGNLADMLTADNAAGSPAAAAGAAQADPAGVAEAAAAQADAARAAAAQADAAGAAAGAAAVLALPVEELHLALRSHNSLRRDGIHTVGELAAHWGNADFAAPEPYDSVVRAAVFHDYGWLRYETAPLLNPATERPYQFLELPFSQEQTDAYQWCIDWLTDIDPLSGLIVSMHRTGLWKNRICPTSNR